MSIIKKQYLQTMQPNQEFTDNNGLIWSVIIEANPHTVFSINSYLNSTPEIFEINNTGLLDLSNNGYISAITYLGKRIYINNKTSLSNEIIKQPTEVCVTYIREEGKIEIL